MEATRVMIVEKDISYLNSLYEEVNRHPLMQVVSVATTGEQVLAESRGKTFDLILMDIDSDDMDQAQKIRTIVDIRKMNPTARIIVISALYSENMIAESILAGADSYVLKKHISRYMGEIKYWLREKTPIDIIIYKFREMRFELLKSRLTHAEKEIFDLLNAGLNQREISQRLFKSNATIKKQVKQILAKFEVSTTKELLKKVKQAI